MAKAAVALVMGCVLLSTSAFAMTDNINGSEYLNEGVYEVKITDLGEGESTIIVLPEGVELEDANEGNILYINQKTIVDGAATYAINLGADFKQAATVYAGGTGMSATTLGTLKAYIPVESVTLAAAEGKTVLEIGETVDITAAIAPATASEQAITWSDNVALNGTTATFTATEAGTFTVTATATADNVIGTIEITVNPAAPENIPVTGLTLEVADAELEIGETTTITATVIPDDATDKTITWSENVVADGATATFTAPEVDEDTVFTVTATAGDVTQSVEITVKAATQDADRVFIPNTGMANVAVVTTKNITNANKKWYAPADVFVNGSKKVKIALTEMAADGAVGENYMINVVNRAGEIINDAQIYYSKEGKFFIALVPAANNADYQFELISGDSVNTATVITAFGNLTNPARVNLLDANVILAATRAFSDPVKNKINSNLLAITADLNNDGNVNLLDYNAIVAYTRNSSENQFSILK